MHLILLDRLDRSYIYGETLSPPEQFQSHRTGNAFPQPTRIVPHFVPDSVSGSTIPSRGTGHRTAFPATMVHPSKWAMVKQQLFGLTDGSTVRHGRRWPLISTSWPTGKNSRSRTALKNGVWMRGLQRMTSTNEMDQFILLLELIQVVQLGDTPDTVTWNITSDGVTLLPLHMRYSLQEGLR